jgi:hypothetical protein
MEYKERFERILEEFSTAKYRQEIEKAKQEFFALSGVVHEDNPLHFERINLFLDWYIYERKLNEEDLSPAQFFYDRNAGKFSKEDGVFYKALLNSISTLFLVKSKMSTYIKVKDMFAGDVYKVNDSNFIDLVNKGDIFQGRLISVDQDRIFSSGFCFHDQDARTYIDAEIKKIRNLPRDYHYSFMMKLALMKVKSKEYDHVPIKDIYTEQPKVAF